MRSRRWLALVVVMAAVTSGKAAWAIGDCEDLRTKYALTDVATESGLLAFAVSIDTCESDDGPVVQEKRGPMEAIMVTDLALRNRRWFLSPKGKAQTERVPTGARKAQPLSAWPAFQRDRGFRAVAAVTLATGVGACAVETVAFLRDKKTAPISEAHGKNSFSTFRIALRIHLGETKSETLELVRHAVSAGAPGVWALPLASGLRVYTAAARCDGGPPPGMFDEDGDCYAGWYLGYKDLPFEKTPGLSQCAVASTAPTQATPARTSASTFAPLPASK